MKGFDLYKELREINPSPYMYYFNFAIKKVKMDIEVSENCIGSRKY